MINAIAFGKQSDTESIDNLSIVVICIKRRILWVCGLVNLQEFYGELMKNENNGQLEDDTVLTQSQSSYVESS